MQSNKEVEKKEKKTEKKSDLLSTKHYALLMIGVILLFFSQYLDDSGGNEIISCLKTFLFSCFVVSYLYVFIEYERRRRSIKKNNTKKN